MTTAPPYKTVELEIASFLKATGHKLFGAQPHGKLVEFSFEPTAESAVERYFAGASLPAINLFEAHRSLRALIQQVREHQSHRNGTDRTWKQSPMTR